MAYLMAVEEYTDWAIERAAKEFIKGEVDKHDRRFAPSTAQFAERVKYREIKPSTVAYVARNPELLDQQEYPSEYRAEMRRRVGELLSRQPLRVTAGDPDGAADAA